MELEIEVWKDIPNYEGLYIVSSLGNLKSIKFGKNRLLKPTISSNGYMIIRLNQKTFNVHAIVAMAFHGHVIDGMKIVVDHIDNNPFNNRADNLRLTTNRDNCTKDMKEGSSKYIGVSWDKRYSKWYAHITFKKRYIYLGLFELEIDAHYAYQKALKEWEQGLDLNVIYPKHIKTSQYKGVYFENRSGKWIAAYKRKFIGYYNTEIEAYEARENYIKNLQSISESVI